MDSRIAPLAEILRLNTTLFRNCLDGLSDEQADPLAPYLDGRQSLDELAKLPALAEIQAAWTKAAHLLRDRLAALTPADLDGPSGAKFPLFNGTVLATLTFLVQHDSYHVGQLSLLRKYCGLPAMRFQ
jgi:uncharacterized damage-inducible protein DinB